MKANLLGVVAFSLCFIAVGCKSLPEDVRNQAKNVPGSIDSIFNAAYEMRDVDLRIVSVVDWAICYHPKRFTVGTTDEVIEMHRSGKPVFYCCPDGILSTWLLAAASNTYDFSSVVIRSKSQYRMYYSTSSGVIAVLGCQYHDL